MKTTIQEQDGNVVAILDGNLDTAAAAETEKAMSPLNNVEGKDIIIDCTDLAYISSAGLRIFLGIQYLCLVYVLKHAGGRDGLKELYDLINGENDANWVVADMMMEQAKTLSFMRK